MSIIDVIDQLETLVSSGRRVPFTPNVVVNEEEVLDLLDRARLELPEEIRQARYTVEQQQRLIEEAEEQARRLLARAEADATQMDAAAREHAEALVAQHEITRGAEQRGGQIVGEAEQAALRIRTDADAYVRQVMEELEQQIAVATQGAQQAMHQLDELLVRTAATVRKGIESLPPPGTVAEPSASRRRRR